MMRVFLYLFIASLLVVRAMPLKAQVPDPVPMEDFEDEDDEEDFEEPPTMRPPPIPTPFNTANPNAGGAPSIPNTRPPGPGANPLDRPFNNFQPAPLRGGVGSTVGTMMANPSKVKFRIVEGEFYEKGQKRGRGPVK